MLPTFVKYAKVYFDAKHLERDWTEIGGDEFFQKSALFGQHQMMSWFSKFDPVISNQEPYLLHLKRIKKGKIYQWILHVLMWATWAL